MAWLKDLLSGGASHVAHDSGDVEIVYEAESTIIHSHQSRYPGDGRDWTAIVSTDGTVTKARDTDTERIVTVLEGEAALSWKKDAVQGFRGYHTNRWHAVE